LIEGTMKKLVLILSCYCNIVFSQTYPVISGAPEMYLLIKNASANTTYHYTLEPISQVYTFDVRENPNEIISECNSDCDAGDEENGVRTDSNGNVDANDQQGWGFNPWGTGTKEPQYGYGAYKLVNDETGDYVYIELRDDRYSRLWNTTIGGYHADFRIRHNFSNHTFDYDASADGNWITGYSRGSIIRIWTGRTTEVPRVEDFPNDFFENSLGLSEIVADLNDQNSYANPTLIWGKEQDEDVTKYRVFRAVTNSSTPPSNSQFEWFYECNDNVLFYKDAAIEQNSFGSKYVHYFVESYDESVFKNRTIKRTMDYVEVAWQNCLVLTESNSNPRLVWGPHPTMNPISGYKIYRAVHSNPVNPALRNYQLAAAINNSTFSWIDTDVNLNSTSNYIYYIVKAYYSTTLSDETNSVGAYGQYNPSKQASEVDENIVLSLSNYPNPFNPETTISYSIPKSSLVNITVYDLLGRIIAELINEIKEAGSYEVNFNAENLPSGLFIYKLTTNVNIVTKKMMLLR